MKKIILLLIALSSVTAFAQKKEVGKLRTDTMHLVLSKFQQQRLSETSKQIDSLRLVFNKLIAPLYQRQNEQLELILDASKYHLSKNDIDSLGFSPGRLIVRKKKK